MYVQLYVNLLTISGIMPFTLPRLQTKREGERRREREMDKRKTLEDLQGSMNRRMDKRQEEKGKRIRRK